MANSQTAQVSEVEKLKEQLEQERQGREEAEMILERGLHHLIDGQRPAELLQRIAMTANESVVMEETMQIAMELICEFTGWPIGHVLLLNEQYQLVSSGLWHNVIPAETQAFCDLSNTYHFASGDGMPGMVLETGQIEWITDFAENTSSPRFYEAQQAGLRGAFAFPLLLGSTVVGVMEFFTQEMAEPNILQMEVMMQIGAQLGRVIERQRAQEQIRHQFDRLTALRAIDTAINGSLDLRLTLSLLLNQVISLLNVDYASVLRCEPRQGTLTYVAGRGHRADATRLARINLGFEYANEVLLERRIIHLSDLGSAVNNAAHANLMSREGFVSYFAVPLLSKGQVQGVLEIFHTAPLDPNPEWCDFLETLAGPAAIAIDNTTLFEGLQRSNLELTLAYDATIEGWSRALDLRDHETEGHTRRVTTMTVRLARAWGLPESDIIHVRRGALLHDIGKMGIPDSILLKPGPLTPEERAIMSQHPQLSLEMLSPIAFLHAALEIPFAHHEKWDGTGYPRGLKGEEIPVSARLFAIVDVWDALRFDRPYRKAWPEEKVREHLRSLSGSHFDPRVVDTFLSILESDGAEESVSDLRAA